MRKLLLGTSALVAATFSANALADVSISGYYEWRYESRSSQVDSVDGAGTKVSLFIPMKEVNTDYKRLLEWAAIDGNNIEEAD